MFPRDLILCFQKCYAVGNTKLSKCTLFKDQDIWGEGTEELGSCF